MGLGEVLDVRLSQVALRCPLVHSFKIVEDP